MVAGVKQLLTMDEVLALLGVHRRTLQKLIARGEFPRASLWPGKRRRCRWRAGLIEDWLRAQERTAAR